MGLYSFLLKLLPCIILTVFTGCLIHAMYQVRSGTKEHGILIMMSMLCRLKRKLLNCEVNQPNMAMVLQKQETQTELLVYLLSFWFFSFCLSFHW